MTRPPESDPRGPSQAPGFLVQVSEGRILRGEGAGVDSQIAGRSAQNFRSKIAAPPILRSANAENRARLKTFELSPLNLSTNEFPEQRDSESLAWFQ